MLFVLTNPLRSLLRHRHFFQEAWCPGARDSAGSIEKLSGGNNIAVSSKGEDVLPQWEYQGEGLSSASSVTTRTIVQIFFVLFFFRCNSRAFESLVVQLY